MQDVQNYKKQNIRTIGYKAHTKITLLTYSLHRIIQN